MKKTLLSVLTILISTFLFAQDCSELFISEVVEGSANSKCIEIYNPTEATIDLADYLVKRYANGVTTADGGYTTDIQGTIEPDGTFILVNGQTTTSEISPACDPALQAIALSNGMLDGDYPAPMYQNGNDAITIEKKDGTIVDIYGKVGEDPGIGWCDVDTLDYVTGTAYWWLAWTKDHSLVRKRTVLSGVIQNPGTPGAPVFFDPSVEWDTLPRDTWDHLTWHDCDCHDTKANELSTKKHDVFFYPNPVIDNTITIRATDIIFGAEIINMIGQSIFRQENTSLRGDMHIDLNDIEKGMYLLRLNLQSGQNVTKKLLVK